MAGLQMVHCVEIRVPAKEGGPCFGSGYALAPHWVLTAHHVLFPQDRDPDSKSFQIVWRDAQGCPMPERTVARDDIVWNSERHDIALIRCEPLHPDVVSPWDLSAQRRPVAHSRCDCVGYLAGLQDDAHQPRRKTPSGTLSDYSRDEIAADLDGLNVQFRKDEDWSGFSGSAVFSGNRLVGIVRTVNTGESGKGLTLSFIAPALLASGDEPEMGRLRDVPGFLVCPGRRACWEKLRAGVVKRLDTRAALREYLAACCRKDLPPGAEIPGTEDLADRLFDLPLLELGRSLNSVLDPMLQPPPDEAGIQAVEYLALVWLRLLAADQGAVPPLDGAARGSNTSPLPVVASQPSLLDLESKLAEASGSDPMLHAVGDDLRSPLDLTPAHNAGLDPDGRRAQQDVKDGYAAKNSPGIVLFRSEAAKASVKEHVLKETGMTLSALPNDDAQSGLSVSSLLYSEGKSRSYYVRIPSTWEGEEAKALRALGSWAPELMVIDLEQVKNPDHSLALGVLHRIILRCQKALPPR
jgi:hypothetical protein